MTRVRIQSVEDEGSTPQIWIRDDAHPNGGYYAAGGAGIAGASLIWRPGVASAGNAVETWAEVAIALAATDALVTVIVDGSIADAHILAADGDTDCQGRLHLRSFNLQIGDNVYIDEGATLTNLYCLSGKISVWGEPTATPSLAFDMGFDRLFMREGSSIKNGGGAIVEMVLLPSPFFGNNFLTIEMEDGANLDSTNGPGALAVIGCLRNTGVLAYTRDGAYVTDEAISGGSRAHAHQYYDGETPPWNLTIIPNTTHHLELATYIFYDDGAANPQLGVEEVQGAIDELKRDGNAWVEQNDCIPQPEIVVTGQSSYATPDDTYFGGAYLVGIRTKFNKVLFKVDSAFSGHIALGIYQNVDGTNAPGAAPLIASAEISVSVGGAAEVAADIAEGIAQLMPGTFYLLFHVINGGSMDLATFTCASIDMWNSFFTSGKHVCVYTTAISDEAAPATFNPDTNGDAIASTANILPILRLLLA